jgi:hypothetical protein
LEPVVYVAFRWYCCVDRDHGASLDTWNPFTPPFDYRIAAPSPRFGRYRVPASLWVQRDLSVLDPFGGTPYRDVVLLAAYPLSVLWASPDFIIYHDMMDAQTGAPDVSMGIGHVSSTDVLTWR